MQDKVTKVVIYHGRGSDGELFQIPIKMFWKNLASPVQKLAALLGQKVKSAVWHQRLGRPSNEVLSVMLQQSNIVSASDSQQHVCTYCIFGKLSRQAFLNRTEQCSFPF